MGPSTVILALLTGAVGIRAPAVNAEGQNVSNAYSFELQPMELPPEYRIGEPETLPGGCETTTHQVWEMLVSSRDGDLGAARRMIEGCPGLVHASYNSPDSLRRERRTHRAGRVPAGEGGGHEVQDVPV